MGIACNEVNHNYIDSVSLKLEKRRMDRHDQTYRSDQTCSVILTMIDRAEYRSIHVCNGMMTIHGIK